MPAMHCLSQNTDFLFCCFYGHFSTEKRKKRKCGCLFRPKNKTPKNKKIAFSGAEK